MVSVPIVNSSTKHHEVRWEYGFHHTKEAQWEGTCQSGRQQSPINIVTSQTKRENNFQPLVFHGYNKRILGEMSTIKNNGHTVGFGFSTSEYASAILPSIKQGGLDGTRFLFVQAHFHWGATNDEGSEHTLNKVYAPMEMHLVHWNKDLEKSFQRASKTNAYNALAVLSVQFKIGKHNKKLEPTFNAIKEVIKQGSKTVVPKGIKLEDFLPENTDQFYRYNGSLTTPGCDEIILWTIFKQPVEISQEQINRMRKVTYHHAENHTTWFEQNLSNNYRSTQNLHERVVLDVNTATSYADEPKVVRAGWGGGGSNSNAGYSTYKFVLNIKSVACVASIFFLSFFDCFKNI